MRTGISVLLWAVLAACPLLDAQSTFGTVLGTVTDASGAAIAGAKLTLRNIDRGTSATADSSEQGFFEFLNLESGRYQVTAERASFASQSSSEFILEARETRRADFSLPIAPRTEVATVTARISMINTENGVIADSKNSEQITRLPLNYRATATLVNSPLYLLSTVPGVQGLFRYSIGGGLPGQIEISIDGISAMSVRFNGPDFSMNPSAEMLSEFRVTSVGAGAAFGQMGDVAMVTRGGTNQLHGGLFWYHQNRALDAAPYGTQIKPQKVFNNFGGSFGGPIDLPHIYSGRNRTFFFADYEGLRDPATFLQQYSVPTGAMHRGDLTGVPGAIAVDPDTGAPFPGNQIPETRISSVARALLDNYYPLPNVPTPGAAFNYQRLAPASSHADGYDIRVDHVISSKQQIFGRWSDKPVTYQSPAQLVPDSASDQSFRSMVLSDTWAPSATVSNELRFGWVRSRNLQTFPVSGKQVVKQLGLVGLSLLNTGDRGGFPLFVFEDGTFTNIGYPRPADNESRTLQFTDTLSWIRGRHTMKFGADVRHVGYRWPLNIGETADFGEFYFSGSAFSGNEFADLLLGLPQSSAYGALGPDINEHGNTAAFFAQDSWRVARRLTLDLGLRWEVHPPFGESAGDITNFDHQTGDVIIPDQTISPAPIFLASINACQATSASPCTKVLTASQAGLPEGLRRTYYADWSPRVGFAWQPWPDGKTVVRGAIGRYTQTMLGFLAYGATGIHTSDYRTFTNYQGPGQPPLFALPDVGPPASVLGNIATASFTDGVDPTLKDPHSWQWDFTIERELPWSTSLRASYVGVQSAGMPVRVNFNQVPASTTPYSASRVPFPQWLQLISDEGLGFANYQGMQLELNHRTRNNIFFQASYVLAKDIGEVGAATASGFPSELAQFLLADRFNTRYDRGNVSGLRRNRFLLTGLIPLPFGQGRKFGSRWNGLEQAVLGGWELSTVAMIQSGPYQTPTTNRGFDQSNTNIVGGRGVQARPDRVGNGNLANPTADMYYDKSAFVPVPVGAGRFGNAGAGILRGPGAVAIAAGLAKSFALTERVRLRMEGTFTNLPNHPNFSPPSVNINDRNFGKLTQVQGAENSGNRTGQVGVRIEF
jgi:Carboxypeptidase regulatory-like domain/TonB dependent receptor-like, beta-barrel